ncbi:hypothetical protein SprV_0200757300 [Sparganum proliferum]
MGNIGFSLPTSLPPLLISSDSGQLRGGLIQAFRVARGLDCALRCDDFFELATAANFRGHPFKLRVPQESWNNLPETTVLS